MKQHRPQGDIAQADKYTIDLNYIANKNISSMLDYYSIIDLETSDGTNIDGQQLPKLKNHSRDFKLRSFIWAGLFYY